MARSSFRDGPWAGPGSHEHRLMSPFSEVRVHGFRARGRSPRPGMTRRMIAPFSSRMAHVVVGVLWVSPAVRAGRQPELDAAVRSGADWTGLMTPAAQGGFGWRR